MAAAWNGHTGEGGSAPGFRIGTRTHIGLRRERNEDYLATGRTRHGMLLVVCDGMGGHRGGELASRLAADTVLRSVEEQRGSCAAVLRAAAAIANDAVLDHARANPEFDGMGTTLVAALLHGSSATIANVGDSRAYLFRAGELRRVTRDHSLVWEMVERGELTELEAESHPRRNVITRALGGTSNSEADIFELSLQREDVILIATDGLHGMIADASIREVLATFTEPARACDELVERALAAGGKDNVSVIVARYDTQADIPESPTDPAALDESPPTRGPRGLGLIVGVGLGAILLMVLLVMAWFYALEPDIDKDVSRHDSINVVRDSVGGIRYDSAGVKDTVR